MSDTGSAPARVYLSSPHMGEEELELVKEAFASNWIAPLGPHVDGFERELAAYVQMPYAAALSSGTAALHLALRILGLARGDEVVCSTLTFSASANPILYEGAQPVFVDSEASSWNMDPELLRKGLEDAARRGKLPRAVIAVDLYGQCADYGRIVPICEEFGVPLIEDAAEALGATCGPNPAGSFGKCSVFSFNGNKIITTSGGGMLVSRDRKTIERARYLATQARDPAPHYQHSTVGFNYRLSNVLAAIGRGQLKVLPSRIEARKRNFEFYRSALSDLPGIRLLRHGQYGESNYWLTCLTVDAEQFGATREDIRITLERENIEARPVWKPLHMQPVFAGCRSFGGAVSEALFADGLCLPSGSNLLDEDLARTVALIRQVHTSCRKT